MIPEALYQQLKYSVESLPTRFGRLVFLVSLRDPHTGRYLQEGWAILATVCEIHQALEEAHRESFSALIALPLEELCRELKGHLASLDPAVIDTAKLWLEIEPFWEMIPQRCSAIERSLFVSQMRLALEMLLRLPESFGEVEGTASARPLVDLPLQRRYLN